MSTVRQKTIACGTLGAIAAVLALLSCASSMLGSDKSIHGAGQAWGIVIFWLSPLALLVGARLGIAISRLL